MLLLLSLRLWLVLMAAVFVGRVGAAGERHGEGHRRIVVGGEAVESGVGEGRGDDDYAGRGVERAYHGAANDLAMRAGERDGEPRSGGRGLWRHGGLD
jgi:hypothetical protein